MKTPFVVALLLCLAAPVRAGNESLDGAADLSRAAVLAGHPEGAGAAAAKAFAEGTLASAAVVPVRASAGVKDRSAVLTHRAAAAQGEVGVPRPQTEWNAKERGGKGFVNGFNKGFRWTLTPADKIGNLGVDSGTYFAAPNIWFLPALVVAVVVGIALLPVAAVVGLGRGLYGAVAGEREF